MSLKEHVPDIAHNKNPFTTHLERSYNERNKLKEEIIAQVNQINKTYGPTSNMLRFSTFLTKGNLSPEKSVDPFLRDTPGEIPFTTMDIPRPEEWPKFSGEGEYNYIKLIRKRDMSQKDLKIPNQLIVEILHYFVTRTSMEL
ncbi:hypothetical protein O181_026824 [Austropuccinia psidii MF-1]|uniref:Uncharacterized protein n=1 Tax=Austropuccinia psidii MF-1 TaxID=1389203 RepID=A0A9Q3CKP7_9BASI|nr:hypothetical protein [Austropuccinia psidii MF-1]